MRDLKGTRPIVGTRQGAGSTRTSVPIIVSLLDGEDIRWIANIVAEIDATPHWWPYCKRHRVSMLLHLFASLEPDGCGYPSTTITVTELAHRARCKAGLAYKYLRWLLDKGYLVRVMREDGAKALAFCWHMGGGVA